MNFKLWLLNQSPKAWNIVSSATDPGKWTLQISFGGQVEGELDNITTADLQALQQVLNQKYPQKKP